jgi:hypothetical protein
MLGLDLNSLLSGAFGGVLVLLLGTGYSIWQAISAQNEERLALLLLVNAEVSANTLYLGHIHLMSPSTVIQNLRSDVWNRAQIELAKLLPISDMKALILYYELIRIEQISELAYQDQGEISEEDWNGLEDLRQRAGTALRMIQGYVQDPNFVDVSTVPLQRKPDESEEDGT